ncbi:hypothetical protein ACJX0J_035111, partial [Zea mays]
TPEENNIPLNVNMGASSSEVAIAQITCINMAKKIGGDLNGMLVIADGDETPAALEILADMDVAKNTIKEALKGNERLLKRWETQIEQKLSMFNDCMWKMFAIAQKELLVFCIC